MPSNPTPTLEAFISSVFNNSKSPKEIKMLQDLSLMALEKSPIEFANFLDTLTPEQLKAMSIERIKNLLIRRIAREREFTQEHYDLLMRNTLGLELKNFIGLKKNNKITFGQELLEKLIQEQSPKSDRVDAIYALMSDYKKAFDSHTPLNLADIEKYKEKINHKSVEKEIKQTKGFYWVNRFGNKVHALSSSRYKKKETTTKRKVKTDSQKGFEQVYVVFLHFLAKHLRDDFLNILEILDLDFLTAFKKISSFNPTESLEIWKKFTNRLDITSYYDSLNKKEKEEFEELFEKIKNNIANLAGKKTNKFSYSGSLDFDKGTKQNIEKILDFCFVMTDAGFTPLQISDNLGVFETSLKKMYPSTLPMNDFLFTFLPSQVKLTKEKKEKIQNLITQYEKEALDLLLEGKMASVEEKKISIKKYKI